MYRVVHFLGAKTIISENTKILPAQVSEEETLIRRLLPGKYPQWTGPEMEGSIPSRGTRVHVETATHISLRHAALYAIGERHH